MTTDSDSLAALKDAGFIAGELGDRMGIELTGASPDRVEGRMPVEGNRQPFGLLHGGASCVLAESLGSTGAFLHAEKLGKIGVGIEINATHHRSATEGHVYGVAVPVHQGRTLSTWDITITDDAGRKICTSRLTCMLRDAPSR